jgi:hypothetical protein
LKQKAKNHTEKATDDPLKLYGFGLLAYRNIIYTLFLLFAVLSIIMMPALSIYSKGNGFHPEILKTKFAGYSIGNLGYSTIQCTSVPTLVQKAVL